MPRRPRVHLDGVPLHIVQRGHNREPCFFGEEDYLSYLHWLGEALEEYRCALHAYVLMTNHVHLLLTPKQAEAVPRLVISAGAALRAVRQSQLPAHRHAVGQPLQVLADPGADLPARLPALHRTEPGAGGDGGRSGPLPLEQLPGERPGAGRHPAHPARPVPLPR
ncbi:MAG: transposase [Comamonadaceae bacterium]|nr:transposase [Comamonadaceae bacterium]